jgi:hypothetical protein
VHFAGRSPDDRRVAGSRWLATEPPVACRCGLQAARVHHAGQIDRGPGEAGLVVVAQQAGHERVHPVDRVRDGCSPVQRVGGGDVLGFEGAERLERAGVEVSSTGRSSGWSTGR